MAGPPPSQPTAQHTNRYASDSRLWLSLPGAHQADGPPFCVAVGRFAFVRSRARVTLVPGPLRARHSSASRFSTPES
jgi:hypothetical protein